MTALLLQFWRPIAGALAILAALAGVYWWGYASAQDAARLEALQAAQERAKVEKALRTQVEGLSASLERLRTRRADVARTIVKEIPTYVQEPPVQCAGAGLQSAGFRVLHDAAAAGEPPRTSSLSDAAPVPATVAAETVASNYAGCHDAADQVEGWRQWWLTVKPK